jgi:hypothetical protein
VLLVFRTVERRGTYTRLAIDDLIDYFQQVNQDILLEKANQPEVEYHGWASYTHRRDLRLRLDLLKDYIQRMCRNAARPGHVAQSDLFQMRRHKLEYPQEALTAIHGVIDADQEFQRFAASRLRKIWFWSLIGFEGRSWGPVPDLGRFRIAELVKAYNRVKLAAETYALLYGEVGRLISEEIHVKM